MQILQVTAVDLDTGNNARLSYRLHGSAAFRINSNTGWIYLAQNLDRETLDRHALTVLATDNGSPAATASASVLVTVLDDNDNDPHFERDFYGFELIENLPSGTLVGSVSATDPDLGKNSLLRYTVVQANSSFTVDPDTGIKKIFSILHPYFSFFFRLHAVKYQGDIYEVLIETMSLSVCESRPGPGFESQAEMPMQLENSRRKILANPFPNSGLSRFCRISLTRSALFSILIILELNSHRTYDCVT